MKQQKPLIVFVVLLVVAGLVWFRYFRSDNPVLTADPGSASQHSQLLSVENPRLRLEEINHARKTEYKTSGRNIFTALAPLSASQQHRDIHAARVIDTPCHIYGPCPDPPPPPLTLPTNMKFYGYGTVPNGTSRRAFFTDGEDVYVVVEGGLLLNRFRILKIGNASIDFEEVSSGRRGTAPLEEQAAGPSA